MSMKFFSKIMLVSLFVAGLSCDADEGSFTWDCKQNSDAIHTSYNANQEIEIKVDRKIDGNSYEAFGFDLFEDGKSETKTGPSARIESDTSATIYQFYPVATYVIIAYDNSETPSSNCWQKKVTTGCGPFNSLHVGVVTASTASISWYIGIQRYSDVNISKFNLFTVNLRKKGETEVTLISTDDHFTTLTGLSSNTEYEVQMVYTCTDNNVYPTSWMSFKTLFE